MRILVSGGAGFVGSHLVERLLGQGHHVVCLDNFHTGRRANLAHLKASEKLEVIEGDVADPVDLDVEQIYHLACPASPPHYQKDPLKTLTTCFVGTRNMLELAHKRRARLLLASTSEIYGDPLEHPQREGYRGNVNPIGPRACYDEGKRIGETLCFDYQRHLGVAVRVVRIFNTYGPRMLADDGRVVSNFVVQALKNEPLTLYGDGSQTRSFCYVDDLVSGLGAAMSHDSFSGPVNLGNPGEFTVRQLAELVIAKTGSRSPIETRPLPVDDPTRRKPDISVAQERLGWSPKVVLNDGLDRTIGYFRELVQS